MTAEQLTEAEAKDVAAARQQYGEKILEVTGLFEHVSATRADEGMVTISLRGGKKQADATDYESVLCKFTAEQFKADPRLRSFSRGQRITVRGKAHWATVSLLEAGQLVSVGPSTAVPTTLAEIESALDKKEGKARFDGKDVLVRVTLKGSKPDLKTVSPEWALVPPEGSTKSFRLEFPFMNNACRQELGEQNSGDTIIALAQVKADSETRIRLSEARVLKSVPPDLRLPDGKK